ncbi:MAG TPA: class I SAM-dependent methyltransferase [Candidatus Polarisedimenticolia bacterium]|jgi:SAM-dependent methyltransferase|nr:class I SAM-dependent methyltransferase [Candidatus Polarisedimenticolia bacterium]
MRRRGAILVALSLMALSGGAVAAVGADDAVPPPPRLADLARRIQIVCFESYPERLLRRMSGRRGPIPEEVRADPRLQVKYLKSEWVVRKGLFYPTWLDELLPALQSAVRPGARFLDLGSGDGRVVFLAAGMGARATGIEFNRGLYRLARTARARLDGLPGIDRAVLKRGDFFKEDFSDYDVFFYFGSGSSAEQALLAKLRREMRPDALLILAHIQGPVPGFERVADHGVAGVYRPAP